MNNDFILLYIIEDKFYLEIDCPLRIKLYNSRQLTNVLLTRIIRSVIMIMTRKEFNKYVETTFNSLNGALVLIGSKFNGHVVNNDGEDEFEFIKQARPGLGGVPHPIENASFYAHVGSQSNRVWLSICYIASETQLKNSGVRPVMYYPGNVYFRVEYRINSIAEADKICTFYSFENKEKAFKHFISLL